VKAKENLKSCEEVITKQKGNSKQSCLKQAVLEQKDKKHRRDIKEMVEDRNRMENQLQRERGLNIQNSQQLVVRVDSMYVIPVGS